MFLTAETYFSSVEVDVPVGTGVVDVLFGAGGGPGGRVVLLHVSHVNLQSHNTRTGFITNVRTR